MKRLLLSLLLTTCACVHSANAITIDIDSALTDVDTLVFDVRWDALAPADPLFTPVVDYGGYHVAAVDSISKLTILVINSPIHSQVNLNFAPGSRLFGPSSPSVLWGESPSSVSGPADGFSARFIYGALPTTPGTSSSSVPDSGSNLALLGFAVVGTVGLRRKFHALFGKS